MDVQVIAFDPKDIMHVRAVFPLCAESHDVEFAQFLDEIVVTLYMLQLAFVALHREERQCQLLQREL